MGKLQVEDAIFGDEPGANAIRKADVFDNPIGGGERFGGQARRVPQKFVTFALDFGRGEFEHFAFVNPDEQKSTVHFEQQWVTFFVLLIDIPIFDGLVVHTKESLLDGLPSDGFVCGNCGAGEAEAKK